MVLGQMLLMGILKMNKLIVVEDKKINSGEYSLELNKEISLDISGNVIIHDINNINNKIELKISNNSSLDYYEIRVLEDDYHFHITLLEEANFNLNLLILNKGKHQIKIDVDMLKNNAYASLNIRAINIENNSNLDIICNGYIKKNTKGNELVENLKGLITKDNDSIKISPIMIVDTNEVSANHLVTIGNFDVEELFYLKSLGLSEDYAKKLLTESFIKHNMLKPELEFLKIGGENHE